MVAMACSFSCRGTWTIEHRLGHRNGSVVAAEIKQVNPQVPIVMLAEDAELPDDAFKSVDALVTKSDGVHFLLATLHFVLTVKPVPAAIRKATGYNSVAAPSPRPVTRTKRAMVSQRSSTGN
jgi:hypothetical protein